MRKLLLSMMFIAGTAQADPPVIEAVSATQSGNAWRFDVTLSHSDTGWDDYADGWRVLDMNGNVLGTRVLYHPHVTEQPFTRSLSGVAIPAGTLEVQIEAKDLIGGWGGEKVTLDLENPNYAR